MSTRRLLAGGTAALVVGALGIVGAASPAGAQASGTYSGFANGTYIHADLLQSGTTRAVDGEVAFSGSSVNSAGLTAPVTNEFQQIVQPATAGKFSFGRGSGIEGSIGQSLPAAKANAFALQKVTAAAPPFQSVSNSVATIPGDPLLYANALRGAAAADWNGPDTCVLGEPISAGQGSVAMAQLLDSAKANPNGTMGSPVITTTDTNPTDRTGSSTSFEYLTNPTDVNGKAIPSGGLALRSVTEEILAPVTIGGQLTIKVAGTWTFISQAGGVPGSNWVKLIPPAPPAGVPADQWPVVQVFNGTTQQGQLTLGQLLGSSGVTIPGSPLATVTIGTKPRAIGSDPAKPKPPVVTDTSASGAVDAVYLNLLQPASTTHVAQVAIGHMEASSTVPLGGVQCHIPVTKVPSKSTITAPGTFTYNITIDNPFDCTLDPVYVIDRTTGTAGVKFTISGTTPTASSVNGGEVIWNNLGPIAPHTSKSASIDVTIPADSAAGTLTDLLTIDQTKTVCKGSNVGGTTQVIANIGGQTLVPPVGVGGTQSVVGPTITSAGVAGERGKLAFTGSNPALPIAALVLLAMAGALFGWRRFRHTD